MVHTDHATLHWIITQQHLTVCQMDILTVLQNLVIEVKYILGVMNQDADTMSHCPDPKCEHRNFTAPDGHAAGEWVDDTTVGIIDHEWFGRITHCLANSSPSVLLSTASNKECEIWVLAQGFHLAENSLLCSLGDLENKVVKKNATAKKKDEENGVEISVWAKEKEEEGRNEEGLEMTVRAHKNEEDQKAAMRGQSCIPKTMQ